MTELLLYPRFQVLPPPCAHILLHRMRSSKYANTLYNEHKREGLVTVGKHRQALESHFVTVDCESTHGFEFYLSACESLRCIEISCIIHEHMHLYVYMLVYVSYM